MAEQQHRAFKTYRGNCHCAAYVYEVKLPCALTRADECNCSVCYKKGVIWAFPAQDDLNFVKGDPATLRNYTFGRNLFKHKFCPTCGTSLMIVGQMHPPPAGEESEPKTGVNVRTFQHGQVDMENLELNLFDGGSLPPAYEPPAFPGPKPQEVEGGKLYTGSCHCGAVKLAVHSQPLDKSFEGMLLECNCSFCGRSGATWIYPHNANLSIVGGEDTLTTYGFNSGRALKRFCRICGIYVYNLSKNLNTPEELAALSEERREWVLRMMDCTPVNLRLIDGVDVRKDVSPVKMDGYSQIKEPYVEP
ncbi:glutathione-dependent formaldehyde-activating enzyme [Xylariomycetidae sp. FL2044]|nr:glutathione-dependent formaldehyde-activating enzyme [Xylariomycetidae sp. FL2044]